MRNLNLVTLAGSAMGVFGLGIVISHAGPLSPPPGAIASSYKTLSEIEPRTAIGPATTPGDADSVFRISQPGSYYLPASYQADASAIGKWGIEIDADNVTLDLAGFSLRGIAGTRGGIRTAPGRNRIAVRNGAVDSWNEAAVYLYQSNQAVAEDLRITNCPGGYGLVAGTSAQIRRCSLVSVGTSGEVGGVWVASDAFIADVTVSVTGGAGITAADNSVIRDCVVRDCPGVAFDIHNNAAVSGCSATFSGATGVGFRAGYNTLITNCQSSGGSTGMQLEAANRVQGCKIGNAFHGIEANYANSIVGNTINAPQYGVGIGIIISSGDNLAKDNHLFAFEQGIQVNSLYSTVVLNSLTFCTQGITGTAATGLLVAPTINNAAAVTNPLANSRI